MVRVGLWVTSVHAILGIIYIYIFTLIFNATRGILYQNGEFHLGSEYIYVEEEHVETLFITHV